MNVVVDFLTRLAELAMPGRWRGNILSWFLEESPDAAGTDARSGYFTRDKRMSHLIRQRARSSTCGTDMLHCMYVGSGALEFLACPDRQKRKWDISRIWSVDDRCSCRDSGSPFYKTLANRMGNDPVRLFAYVLMIGT